MNTYEVVVRATITKTLIIEAEDEEQADEFAHQEFSSECDGDENYDEQILSLELATQPQPK